MLSFLNPRSPSSMLSLYHGILPKYQNGVSTNKTIYIFNRHANIQRTYITKSCFGVVHNIELGGGGDQVCFVNVQ
jgi:hypothetical protein